MQRRRRDRCKFFNLNVGAIIWHVYVESALPWCDWGSGLLSRGFSVNVCLVNGASCFDTFGPGYGRPRTQAQRNNEFVIDAFCVDTSCSGSVSQEQVGRHSANPLFKCVVVWFLLVGLLPLLFLLSLSLACGLPP